VPGFAQSKPNPTVADIALLQGDNRLQTLIEGAKKEGELDIYLPHGFIVAATEAFTKKYGIKVKIWRSSSENILQRIISEARGGRFDVDIVENIGLALEALHRENLLQQVRSPYFGDLMPQAILPHREWVGIMFELFIQGYNTAKINKEDLPKTYQDLLDPKWKGQLGIEEGDHVWFAHVLQELGQEKGIKLFKDIVATNGVSVRKGHSVLGQMTASGEVPLAVAQYSWVVDQLKQKGAPIERFYISQPSAEFSGIGMLKRAPHPHAAVLFYDFMLTDGQEILSKQHAIAASNKLNVAQKQVPMKFMDPSVSLDNNAKWVQTFNEVFKKGGR